MRLIEAINKLKAHESDLRDMGIKNLYMFGSTVRGNERPDSDVDLVFDPVKSPLGIIRLLQIERKASEILGCKADVTTRDGINAFYKPYIEPSLITIF